LGNEKRKKLISWTSLGRFEGGSGLFDDRKNLAASLKEDTLVD